MPFRIELNEASLAKASSLVTGEIWLLSDGVAFPAANWNDFVIVIVGWWAQALLDLETQNSVEWNFMDGPYSAHLTRQTAQLVEIAFYDNHGATDDPGTLVHKAPVFRRALIENVVRVGTLLDQKATASAWTSPDLATLQRNIARLR